MNRIVALHLFFTLLVVSCGHSTILATNPKVELYVDGEHVGRGEGELKRMGPPKTSQLEGRIHGKVVARQEVRRGFTLSTYILAMVSLGTGFIWAWQYPKEIELFVPKIRDDGQSTSPWDRAPGSSPWDNPPGGG